MTIEEAIKISKDGRKNLYEALDKSVPYEQQHTLVALDMAIKSLEAWELVKAYIEECYADCMQTCEDEENGCIENTFKSLFRIIDKHLSEVSE